VWFLKNLEIMRGEASTMNKTKDNALQEKQIKALRLAALKETDSEDMENCVNDMKKHASLNEDEARIVAAAVRAKYLPNIASSYGLDNTVVAQMMGLPMEPKDDDSANVEPNDDLKLPGETAMGDQEDNDLDLPTDITDEEHEGLGEVSDHDLDTATIKIELPADKLEEAQQAIEKALTELLGGDEPFSDEEDEDSEEVFTPEDEESNEESNEDDTEDDDESDEEGEDTESEEDSDDAEGEDTFMPHTASTKVNKMTKKALAQRKAEREAILRLAQAEGTKPKDIGLGKDTSSGTYGGEKAKPFQFNGEAQYKGEDEYPVLTLEDSAGNSLKADNPTFEKQSIPTMNPENLQLKDSYNVIKLEGSPDGTLQYTADFGAINQVPSADPDRGSDQAIPTQMGPKARKTTVAKTVECQGCNNPERVATNLIHCSDCGNRVVICETCEEEGYCPSCAANVTVAQSGTNITVNEASEKEDEVVKYKNNDLTEVKPMKDKEAKASKDFDLAMSRVKTAYAVSTKLALAGIISADEVDQNVELWLSEGLTNNAMLQQGHLMLRAAQSSAQRVAAAAAEKMNKRTASNIGISAFTGVNDNQYAQNDLQSALRGMFTMPRIEE